MRDLSNPKWIYVKGFLFLVSGMMAACLVWMERPTLRVACLLTLAIWCFARAYYFAFYVIQHYVDGDFRYSGLWSFLKYLVRGRVALWRRSSRP